jgi:shikimate dehydrogenase
VIHNTAIKELGLDAIYEIVEVRPGEVGKFLREQPEEFLGTNVTIPHKQTIIESLDELSPVSEIIRAVNTVVRKHAEDGRVYYYGDNTDVAGFLAPLTQLDAKAVSRLRGGNVVILGSGGAARAVAYAIRSYAPQTVTIVARNPMKGNRFIEDLISFPVDGSVGSRPESDRSSARNGLENQTEAQYITTTFDSPELPATIGRGDLIVNATPIGLTPNGHITPLPDATFRPSQIVYDLVYRPRSTRLLQDAAKDGAMIIDGTEMLLAQAAASFVQWFGVAMPMGPVREALDRALLASS